MTNLYFDYAAATPLDPDVLRVMMPLMTEQFYNPSALYQYAAGVRATIEAARSGVAIVLACKSQEVVFTAGCTEANNLAIRGVMQRYPGKKVAVSAIEHDSILSAAAQYDRVMIPVLPTGLVDMHKLSVLLNDPEIVLVSVMYANNEIGTVQPLREIAALIDEKRKSRVGGLPLWFHTDAAQAPNYLMLSIHSLGVDMMSLNGGKIYGPKQSGCLYVGRGLELEPLLYGGGQERGLRSGTESPAQIVGFAEALKKTSDLRESEATRLRPLQGVLIDFCESIGGRILGSSENRLVNNVSVVFLGVDNERLVMELDEQGIQVAAGSACHALSSASSTVLAAIGVSADDAQSSIRISMGRSTTIESVNRLTDMLKELIFKSK